MNLISQQGFSIVQGLVLSTLLAGSALVTSKLVADQKKVAVSTKSKDATDEMTELLYNILQHQDNCTETLVRNGATGMSGIVPLNNGIYNAIRTASDASLPAPVVVTSTPPNNRYIQNSISIRSMRVEFGASVANLNPAVLVVHMQRNNSKDETLRTKDGFGGKDLIRRINLVIQRNPDTLAFRSCFAARTILEDTGGQGNIDHLQTFCNELAPVYHWNNNTNTCELSENACPRDFFFTGISSLGQASRIDINPTGVIFSAGLGAASCRHIRRAIRLSDFISNGTQNCNGRNGVRWIKVGSNRVRIGCL